MKKGSASGVERATTGNVAKWWWWWQVVVIVVVLLLLVLDVVESSPVASQDSSRRSGGRGRLRDDAAHLTPRHEWRRRHKKSSECRLGKERRALHEEWSPNLGPPFGKWTCVKCNCEPVQKKRRIVAKVQCRNIKNECPKVTCDDPVILPGACCKTCPEDPADYTTTDFAKDESPDPPEDATGRDFAVLLNGRTSQTPMTTTRLATGRLSLRRKTLLFSFLLEDDAPSPSSIQFLSEAGEILEQLEPQPTPYEATNSRVCGTWTRVPKEYRALLREEKMWVALSPPANSNEDVISGQISRYVGVDTEVFSSLLKPVPTANQTLRGGGTAIISVDAKTDSLHVSLVFNGIFGQGETHNISLVVELLPSRALPPVSDTVILSKIYSEINQAEVLTTLGESSLRLLTRGRVSMKIWSQRAPELALEGMIVPRATCNVFSAVLSKPPLIAPVSEEEAPPSYGSGWALFTLSNNGTFQYQIFVKGLQVTSLLLETRHRRGHRIVDDLTPQYSEGWANGTYSRPTYRDLDALLRGKLEVVASTGDGDEELRGMMNHVAITEALRSPQPVLLSSSQVPMAATVWVSVDSACVTHYDVMIGGQVPDGADEPFWNLILREEDKTFDPRHEMTHMELETKVKGEELFAHSTELSLLSLSRLKAGVSYLDIVLLPLNASSNETSVLSGLIQGVNVPLMCLLDSRDIIRPSVEIRTIINCTEEACVTIDDPVPPVNPVIHTCKDEENRVFEDGSSWPSPVDPCSMCMCTKGFIKCLDMICHKLECEDAYKPQNACCPVCPGDNGAAELNQFCEFSGQRHSIGSKWHPFLAPKGFDKCASCSCELRPSGSSVVKCSRFPCSPLHCAERDQEHLPDSCCPVCRPPVPEDPLPTADPGMVNDPGPSAEEQQEIILHNGGCKYREQQVLPNGAEWHPRMTSVGIYKCVTCKCKDKNISCTSHQCPTLRCRTRIIEEQECCPQCVSSATRLVVKKPRKPKPKVNGNRGRARYPKQRNSG